MKIESNVMITALSIAISLMLTSFAARADNNSPPDFTDPIFNCKKKEEGTDYRRNDVYTNELRKKVEGAHFTKGVQRGEYGNAGSLEGDFDYVLKKFPNHPKALLMAAKNQMKPGYSGRNKLRKDYFYPKKECYFQIALSIAPDDASVHHVIAIFYHEFGNFQVANRHYSSAIMLAPNNPEVHYNYGLFLIQVGQEDKAAEHAKVAYELGYPLMGLKNKLIDAKKWQE